MSVLKKDTGEQKKEQVRFGITDKDLLMILESFGSNNDEDELLDILDDILNNRNEYIEERPTLELELPYDDTLDVEIDEYDTPRVIIIENEDTQCSRVVIIDL